jgi:hypothetical protein
LFESLLRVELGDEFGERGGLVDELEEGCGAEFEGDVKEGVALFFTEVANDVRVIVGFLEEVDFVSGDGNKVLQQPLDGDGASLELAAKHDGAMGTVSWE